MKKTLLLLFVLALHASLFAQPYFPEGTKWTEIRLDTLKYDSWYSKIDGEWVPNFETIEYRVQGEYIDRYRGKFSCVYTDGPEWTDSLSLLILEEEENGKGSRISLNVPHFFYDDWGTYLFYSKGYVYQFDWSVGKVLYYADIIESSWTSIFQNIYVYGIIDEIKEGYFGGVRPLKYVDLNGKAPDKYSENWDDDRYTDTKGGRIIQGIGITEWNDGECLFGPPNPHYAMTYFDDIPERHYRSMLVHFERDGEVLYDVWPQKEKTTKIVSPLNPSDKEMVNVKSSNRKFYDLQGRRLFGKPARGIYIEDGMKKVIK